MTVSSIFWGISKVEPGCTENCWSSSLHWLNYLLTKQPTTLYEGQLNNEIHKGWSKKMSELVFVRTSPNLCQIW